MVRQGGPAPQRVFNSTSKAYNRRCEHRGTLFEGSYKVIPIERDAYLLHLCRYIHATGVIHGFVHDAGAWPYSNYLEWTGERDGTLVDHDFVRAHFPTPESYREFVVDYLAERRLPKELEAYLRVWEGR